MFHDRCKEKDYQNDQLGDQRYVGCQGGMEGQGDEGMPAGWEGLRMLEMESRREEIK